MCRNKYDMIRTQYPKFISKDQLHKICSISKLSAAYLIQNGIIPAVDTGKKTWRYKIDIEDVITYLEKRKKNGRMIPTGAVNSNKPKRLSLSYSSLVDNRRENQLKEYFSFIYADYPDVLKTSDIVEMTGLCTKTIQLLLKQGEIKSIRNGNRYVIPKKYVLNYVSSQTFIEAKSNSENFKRILGGFLIWIDAKL